MSPAITITSEELRERVEEHLGRWIPDSLWERSEPYARRKLDLCRERSPEIIGRYLNTRTPGGPFSQRSHNILMGTGNTKSDGTSWIPFQRMSKTRTDIKKLTTISVPQMITSDRTNEAIMLRLNTETSKRLEHHMKRALGL